MAAIQWGTSYLADGDKILNNHAETHTAVLNNDDSVVAIERGGISDEIIIPSWH